MFLHGAPRVWHSALAERTSARGAGSLALNYSAEGEPLWAASSGGTLQVWSSRSGDLCLLGSCLAATDEASADAPCIVTDEALVWDASGTRLCLLQATGILAIYVLTAETARASGLFTAADGATNAAALPLALSAGASAHNSQTLAASMANTSLDLTCASVTRRSDAVILCVCGRTAADPNEADSIVFGTQEGTLYELYWDGGVKGAYTSHWVASGAPTSSPALSGQANGAGDRAAAVAEELVELRACGGLAARRGDGRVGLMQWTPSMQQVTFRLLAAVAHGRRPITSVAVGPVEDVGRGLAGQDTLALCCGDGNAYVFAVQRAGVTEGAAAAIPVRVVEPGFQAFLCGTLRLLPGLRLPPSSAPLGALRRAALIGDRSEFLLHTDGQKVSLCGLATGGAAWAEDLCHSVRETLGPPYRGEGTGRGKGKPWDMRILSLGLDAAHRILVCQVEAVYPDLPGASQRLCTVRGLDDSQWDDDASEFFGESPGEYTPEVTLSPKREVLLAVFPLLTAQAFAYASSPPLLLGNDVVHVAGPEPTHPQTRVWRPLVPPEGYVHGNGPLRLATASAGLGETLSIVTAENGAATAAFTRPPRGASHVVVAGRAGICLYHSISKKWRMFGSVRQENRLYAAALKMWDTARGEFVIVVSDRQKAREPALAPVGPVPEWSGIEKGRDLAPPLEVVVYSASDVDHQRRPVETVQLWPRPKKDPAYDVAFVDALSYKTPSGEDALLLLIASRRLMTVLHYLEPNPSPARAPIPSDTESVSSRDSDHPPAPKTSGRKQPRLRVTPLYVGPTPSLPLLLTPRYGATSSKIPADLSSHASRDDVLVQNPLHTLSIARDMALPASLASAVENARHVAAMDLLATGLKSQGLFKIRIPIRRDAHSSRGKARPEPSPPESLTLSRIAFTMNLNLALAPGGAFRGVEANPNPLPLALNPALVVVRADDGLQTGFGLHCPALGHDLFWANPIAATAPPNGALTDADAAPPLPSNASAPVASLDPLALSLDNRGWDLVCARQRYGTRSWEVHLERSPLLHHVLQVLLTAVLPLPSVEGDGPQQISLRPLAHAFVDALVSCGDAVTIEALQTSMSLLLRQILERLAPLRKLQPAPPPATPSNSSWALHEFLLVEVLLLLRRFPRRFPEVIIHTARQLEPSPLRCLFPLPDGSNASPFAMLDTCLREGRVQTASLYLPLVGGEGWGGEGGGGWMLSLAHVVALRLMWECLLRGSSEERALLLPQLWTFARKREEALYADGLLLSCAEDVERLGEKVVAMLQTTPPPTPPAQDPNPFPNPNLVRAANVWTPSRHGRAQSERTPRRRARMTQRRASEEAAFAVSSAVMWAFSSFLAPPTPLMGDRSPSPPPSPPPPPPPLLPAAQSTSPMQTRSFSGLVGSDGDGDATSLATDGSLRPSESHRSLSAVSSLPHLESLMVCPPRSVPVTQAHTEAAAATWAPYASVTLLAGFTAAQVLAQYVRHVLEGHRFLEAVSLCLLLKAAPEVAGDLFPALEAQHPMTDESKDQGEENFADLLESILLAHVAQGGEWASGDQTPSPRKGVRNGGAKWSQEFLVALFNVAMACGFSACAVVCAAINISKSRAALRQLLEGMSESAVRKFAAALSALDQRVYLWITGGAWEPVTEEGAALEVLKPRLQGAIAFVAAARGRSPPMSRARSHSADDMDLVALTEFGVSSPRAATYSEEAEQARSVSEQDPGGGMAPVAVKLFDGSVLRCLLLLEVVQMFRLPALEACNRALDRQRRKSQTGASMDSPS